MAKKLHKISGFSRFRFNSNGDCFNATTDTQRKREKWGSVREFYGLHNDSNKREVVYVSDIIDHCKAIETEERKKKQQVANGKKAGFKKVVAHKPTPKAKKKHLKAADGMAILEQHAGGATTEQLATKYDRSPSTIRQILSGNIFADNYKKFNAS